LVYAREATFQLWSGVLELGGYDVIVEPFSDNDLHRQHPSHRPPAFPGFGSEK
jgi:hypothetical protein